jgi:hypothetical protein
MEKPEQLAEDIITFLGKLVGTVPAEDSKTIDSSVPPADLADNAES